MVLAILDRLGREQVSEILMLFPSPHTYCVEHLSLDFHMLIAGGRVVESPQDIIEHLVDRDSRVVPSVQNTACYRQFWLPRKLEKEQCLRDNVLYNFASVRLASTCNLKIERCREGGASMSSIGRGFPRGTLPVVATLPATGLRIW